MSRGRRWKYPLVAAAGYSIRQFLYLQMMAGYLLVAGDVSSLLAAEEKKTTNLSLQVDEDLFVDQTETDLYKAVQLLPNSGGQDEPAILSAMQGLASLWTNRSVFRCGCGKCR